MTFHRFIYKNAFRNKRRAALTIISIAFSLFLLILLRTILDTLLNPPITESGALRLVVRGPTGLSDNLPVSYLRKLEEVPHVVGVLPMQMIGAYYREEKNFFPSFATDPEKLWDMFPDFIASEETKEAFKRERTGAVLQEQLMEKYGFKVGDQITLINPVLGANFELKIVGTFAYPENQLLLYFNRLYFEEVSGNPNTVGMIMLMSDGPESMPGIIETVDKMFRNSPPPTRTETEKAFRLGFVSLLGNIQALLGSIAMVVVFTMLLVAASTMAMTIRERLREVAILKSLGFTRRIILTLILGEATFIALLGGTFACAGAFALTNMDLGRVTQGFIRQFAVAPDTYLLALLVGCAIGIFSGILPALSASRMTITQGMRRLD